MGALALESNVVTLDIGADAFDTLIRSYQPPPHLAYRWKNPSTIAVGQRPNPDIDPARLDVSGETWKWRVGSGTIHWPRIALITPIKEVMKEYVCHKIENGSYAGGYSIYLRFKSIQDVLKDPTAWPWSQQHVMRILAGFNKESDFLNLKNFYTWAAEMQIPGFSIQVSDRIKDFKWEGVRTNRDESKRTRKHVLSLSEERALREALRSITPYDHDPLPTSYAPETLIHIDQANGMLGHGERFGDLTGERRIKSRALARLENLGLAPYESIYKDGGQVDHFFRMGDIIPAMRHYHLRAYMGYLHTNIATHIAFSLGARPSQIMGIDESGFKQHVEDGVTYYSIDLPRRKKKTEGKATAKRRKFPSEIGLGQKIETYISLKREAEDIGMYQKPKSSTIPLFYQPWRIKWDPTKPALKGKRPTEPLMAQNIKNFIYGVGIKRSAKDLRANVAQRLADAGYAAALIQEVLDHEYPKTIKAYIQASLNLSEILEKALATHEGYQDHAARLQGIKVISIKDIGKGTDVISGTVNHKLISGIGACNHGVRGGGLCELEIVYSCYGCTEFVPFDDVLTHKQVLKELEAEVIEMVNDSDAYEPVKLAFTHQETILNVKAVIQIVEERGEHE